MQLSVVIPLYNERENVKPLYEAISQALRASDYEIILVDDGSSDGTLEQALALTDPHVRLIRFTRNFGQTSAMAAGIDAAQGTYIALMDGDLQNDPADIPGMLDQLQREKLDVLAGIRANRKDGMLLRKIPSLCANALIRYFSKVTIHDYGCTLKVFKADIAKRLDLSGDLHRFIPILAHMSGAVISECVVQHHPRQYGASKYGIGRIFRVLSDLMLLLFMLKFRQKPMHFFGSFGVTLGGIGLLMEAYLLLLKLAGESIGHRPLFYVGILCMIVGMQMICTGFLAEMLMRTYYESQKKKPYLIMSEYRGGQKIHP